MINSVNCTKCVGLGVGVKGKNAERFSTCHERALSGFFMIENASIISWLVV